MSRRLRLNRRTFLRGVLAGTAVSVGLPPLEAMMNASGTAYAGDDGFPVRFGLFFWGNGMLPDRWIPSSTGEGDEWALSEQLAPLAGLKDMLTVVTGMTVKTENRVPHLSGASGFLSGAPLLPDTDDSFQLPSIDQIIAAEVGGFTRFRSLEFGAEPKSGLSFNGPHSRNPPETSPWALYNRLFLNGFVEPGDEPIADPKLALRRSVLDAIAEDAKSLKTRLGAVDQQRLDQHLEGIWDLEQRLRYMEENPPDLESCSMPAGPETEYPDIDGRPQIAAKNRAFCDLIAMALACDQTRVFSNFVTYPVSNTLFPGASDGHHNLTHDEPGDQPEVNEIVLQVLTEYAYLLEALRAIPEGETTLLDHCAVLATSDVSFGRIHSLDEFPILIGGSASGALKTDLHYRSDKSENASKVCLSLVRAAGVSAGSFGGDEGYVEDGLSAIEV